MKKNLRSAAIFAAFGIFTAGAAICPAQPGRMVGGYNSAAKTDETVVDAARFAVAAQAEQDATLELVGIERAERQIVAGSNYRLCLSVKSKNKREQATATVYLNLQNEFSLSEWIPGNCAAGQSGETAETEGGETPQNETVTYKGNLQVGKTDSVIVYVGEETGDYAAFCFSNKSAVGRAVLAACKNGGQCEFTGEVGDGECEVPGLEASLSFSARITKIESVKNLSVKKTPVKKSPAKKRGRK